MKLATPKLLHFFIGHSVNDPERACGEDCTLPRGFIGGTHRKTLDSGQSTGNGMLTKPPFLDGTFFTLEVSASVDVYDLALLRD